MSVLRRRPWSVAADCSTLARQPQETHGHRGWTDELTAPATSVSRQSVDGDERRFRMSDIVVGGLIFYYGFFVVFFFRPLISELAERNSTIFGHRVDSKCNLKMHVRNLGYPFPLQIGSPETTFFEDFATSPQR